MALAVFARSTKEGQYYLMPMFLIVTPLVFLTLAPGVELNTFYSLVPVTNVALLLKALMLNQTETAAIYFVPVMVPTLLYGFLALRYAAEQFNREEVLFREAERFNLRDWLVDLVRNKRPVITFQMAWSFFVLYMVLRWYLQGRFGVSLWDAALTQILMLLLPAVVFAVLLTRRPLESLNVRAPSLVPTLLALLLVFTVHPVAVEFARVLNNLFPNGAAEELVKQLDFLLTGPLWQTLLVAAVVAPVCEEIVFRGVLLTGFLQRYRPPLAILVSSVLFGVSHMVPQQMVTTTLLGIVLGIIATRTGSILPSMAFHSLHNGMVIYLGHSAAESGVEQVADLTYPTIIVLMGALASAILIGVLLQFPSRLRRVPETPLFG
jgi:sodium transport system permease protein